MNELIMARAEIEELRTANDAWRAENLRLNVTSNELRTENEALRTKNEALRTQIDAVRKAVSNPVL